RAVDLDEEGVGYFEAKLDAVRLELRLHEVGDVAHERRHVFAKEARLHGAGEAQILLRHFLQAIDLPRDRLAEPPRSLAAAFRDLLGQELGVEPDRRERVANL